MATGILINVVGLVLMSVAFTNYRAVTGIPFPASFFARSEFALFALGLLVVQFGNNITSTAYMGVIPDVVPANQRGVASGWMALLSQLGNLFGAFIGGLKILTIQGWLPYTVCATVLLGVGSITIFGLKETPLPKPRIRIHWPTYLRSLWISPKDYPDFAWVWITRALVMLGFYSFLPFINYYLIDVLNIQRNSVGDEAPKLLGVILIFACLSSIYGGQLSDKVGRKKVVYVANGGIAVVALGFILCRDIQQAMIVGSLFGCFYGAYGSVDYALGTDVLPNKAHAGKDMAVWHIAMTLPQSFASPIAGALIASFGYRTFMENGETVVQYTANGYSSVFVLCSICFGIGAILLRNVRGVQ
jgi:MFS family permease